MTAIILGWNPDRWNDWNYTDVFGRVAGSGLSLQPWSVGRHTTVPAGTDAWLLLQGDHGRGLVGHGVVASDVAPDAFSELPGTDTPVAGDVAPDPGRMLVQVAFDALLPPGEQIAVDVLQGALPGIPWGADDASELVVEPADEAAIRALWRDFGPPPGTDPTQPVPGTYPQDTVTRVEVNRFERDPDARRACIAHHGTSCAACGFSFEQKYGGIGADFIPVHHLVPVSQLGSTYELDPITDLVPLCANCHAMAHQGVSTPRTVAQRQAREILGPQ